ncbi:ribulokinase [Alicyclobacillaceae bacterium I2511]|nr:ribulokinase [Alicyclobacillaceae bacterium I2511]
MSYSLGIDFGTESGRVLLLDLQDGRELAKTIVRYPHGVMDRTLHISGQNLSPDWALQDPEDYLYVLQEGIPKVLLESGINRQEVIGLGVDFTSCTVLPVNRDGIPLCHLPEFRMHPHAWVKLWKHHAATPIAERMNTVAREMGASFLSRYGDRISPEWYFPKLLEVFEEDPDVYCATDAFVEAADWIVWYLTGQEKRNSCTAGYKAFWDEREGLPPEYFFERLNSQFTNPAEKLGKTFYRMGTRAGYLRAELADSLGLHPGVAIAVGNIDAHVSVPGVGVNAPGALVMVVGTSICHLTVTEQEIRLPGITGIVKDGVLPGYFGYEAGQAAVGDMLAWYVEHAVPTTYLDAAKKNNISIYEYLEKHATKLYPGASGLLVLDWWNGNRSILGDANLSGVLIGLTLSTTPVEIYRALLESIAFGTKRIIDNFLEHGVPIEELVATGGLAWKSPLLMQIYADVCGLPVTVYDSEEVPGRGAALFGAVAAGKNDGGFATIEEASEKLRPPLLKQYTPRREAVETYRHLYSMYKLLYSWFGEEQRDILHNLKHLRGDQLRKWHDDGLSEP